MFAGTGGLTSDNVETVHAALRTLNADDLSDAFGLCVELQESALRLLLQEMFSTRLDVIYWDRFRKSSPWDKWLTRINSRVFRSLFHQQDQFDILNHDSYDVLHYMESLRYDFGRLAMFLGEVQLAGAHLKEIYQQTNSSGVLSLSDRFQVTSPAVTLTALTKQNLTIFLTIMLRNIQEHVPHLQLNTEVLDNHNKLQTEQIVSLTNRLLQSLKQLQQSRIQQVAYPLGITTIKCHRPSPFERYWFRNLLTLLGGVYASNLVISMVRSGELQRQAHFLYDSIRAKFYEHVYEPITKLGQELFDTIRKREHIVTREDLEQSKAALDRMLLDFAASRKGSAVIIPSIKEEIMKKSQAIFGSDTASNNTSSLPVPVIDEITPEQAWTALMKEYEKELQTPVGGMIYGNLFTAMLIQMQKLKVHTEAAMLTMDQILASNELTIAATAAMPAFFAFGIVLWTLRNQFRPRAESPGLATQHFRLILGDVERSVMALMAATEGSEEAVEVQRQRGYFYFNLARLRSKFNELFFPLTSSRSSSLSSLSMSLPTMMTSSGVIGGTRKGRPSLYSQPQRSLTMAMVHWITGQQPVFEPLIQFTQSAHDLIRSVWHLLFGTHEQLSGTSLTNSLEQDVLLLECPETEVDLKKKLAIIQSMRVSYKCFAPAT